MPPVKRALRAGFKGILRLSFRRIDGYSPHLHHRFSEGARTRIINLPASAPPIREVSFQYGDLPGGRRAHVELWGR